MGQRYFITGASGLLGRYLVPYIAGKGHNVLAVNNSHELSFNLGNVEQVRADLSQRPIIEDMLTCTAPDVIIHAAGLTNVDLCEREPEKARLLNTDLPAWIAQWAQSSGRQYVFISTDHITNGERACFNEDIIVSPLNTYARTKVEAESLVRQYVPDALILRTNFFGKGPRWRKSITDWVWENVQAGHPIPGFTDSFFSPISAYDLSRIMLTMIERRASGIFHLAGRERISKYEFARLFTSMAGFDEALILPASMRDVGLAARRPADMSMSVEKIETYLGARMPTAREGINSIISDYMP